LTSKVRQQRRGQALVEFALALPLFLLLVFGLIDLGRFVLTDSLLSQAAREGARLAAVEASWIGSTDDSCGSDYGPVCPATTAALASDVQVAANRMVAGLGGSITAVYVSCDAPGGEPSGLWNGVACASRVPGNVVSVRVEYTYESITPVISTFIGPVLRHGAATMVIN
jgi:Flp pilus assembly protein TadG